LAVFYPLPLHDALPICLPAKGAAGSRLLSPSRRDGRQMARTSRRRKRSGRQQDHVATSQCPPIRRVFRRAQRRARELAVLVRLRSEEHTSELQSRENLV